MTTTTTKLFSSVSAAMAAATSFMAEYPKGDLSHEQRQEFPETDRSEGGMPLFRVVCRVDPADPECEEIDDSWSTYHRKILTYDVKEYRFVEIVQETKNGTKPVLAWGKHGDTRLINESEEFDLWGEEVLRLDAETENTGKRELMSGVWQGYYENSPEMVRKALDWAWETLN